MVSGCTYNRVYNVHRFIEGKNGGKYEIGNMFAICPNHHGEYHARLINFEKISDCELKII
jgi:predicted restriction endonuclease|tara:strand:- start:50 stop:229 length:180 start_codon:yes stop_codon:yes gene_type:complete